MPTPKHLATRQRAAALRILAEECRAVAESFSSPETRSQMARIADSYERMACTLDDITEDQLRLLRA